MKRLTVFMIAILFGVVSMIARKGYSQPVDVKQPDGTKVTLMLHGDEFLSFVTTIDGYTVVKDDDGFYRYARKTDEGTLCATAVVARNPEVRNAEEVSFLARQRKMQHPDMLKDDPFRKSAASLYMDYTARKTATARNVLLLEGRIDYSKFKGLVVLVEFNDRKFGIDNPKEFYQKMTSEKNYQDTSRKYYPVDVEGSARDYFFDNSRGIFDPTFDVVGPVTIDYSCTYPHPKKNGVADGEFFTRMVKIIKSIMSKIDSMVDFKDYDLDNDGVIDMVYIIFAGYGSYCLGNNEGYMWPHANNFSDNSKQLGMIYDHKYFGRYACSMEIQDYESLADKHVWLDGIGTICHEFSHVLGLADHYDTNFAEDGSAPTSGLWDVMDNGADGNHGLSPVGYNSFESYLLGFTDIKQLEQEGNYELNPFGTSNEAFILQTGTPDEDFFIENRQKEKWDRCLPGHGLLVWRADTSDPTQWMKNKVNTSPSTMHLELLRAKPNMKIDSNYTPFPGTGRVTSLTAETTPALTSSKGEEAVLNLSNIAESDDGVITFTASKKKAVGIGIVAKEDTNSRCYNMMGQQVSATQKGLLIQYGKKMRFQ